MKKFLSILLSAVVIATSLSAFALTAQAATSYETQLKKAGFTDSYIADLAALHKKYPNWKFVPFVTGLNWSTAVAGERSSHSKQLIQKQSGLSSSYYCNCSSCYKNGKYVIQEGSSWVSASKTAVEYYMDPRNFLDEKHIFQFESTSYDSSQTQSGVESIISSTWMKDAYIYYHTTSGSQAYYTSNGKKVKYSAAIINAAKNSGMSAYYLASKIVQEVGGSSASATGASGQKSPFLGMYNYYNIGANSAGIQGLEWASGFLKATSKTTLYSDYDSSAKKGKGTKTSVSEGQYMSYISTSGSYYKVRLYTVSGISYTAGKVGYVPISALRTKYFNYGRPWTNPYKCIYNGAEYIANSFSSYQNTGYLQKFNVNSKSGKLYSHEYMANVQAAAAESVTTYKAYNSAGILSSSKVFYIPVFKNMPNDSSDNNSNNNNSNNTDSTKVSKLTLQSRTTTSLTFSWNAVKGAKKYYISITNVARGTTFDKTVTTNSASLNNLTEGYSYAVKVRAYTSDGWQPYSNTNTKHTLPAKVTGVKSTATTATTVSLRWNKAYGASGYYIYEYSGGKYKRVMTVSGGSKTSAKVLSLSTGAKHRLCVAAYVSDGATSAGAKSSLVTGVTKPYKVANLKLSSPAATKLKASWKKNSAGVSGYQISYSRDSKFNNVVATKNITSPSTVSYVGKNFTKGVTYYIRVRAYVTVGGKNYYGAWSDAESVKSK